MKGVGMEEKLRAIVTKIEVSSLKDEDKEALYATISEGLQATVWPVLLKYMPKEQLQYLADDPKSRVTVESYAKLIEDTIKDGVALKEIEGLMNKVLEEVEKALAQEGIK
jgi:RNA-binding protein YhbY